ILSSTEKSQARSTFRLESGAYGIPKSRQAPSTPSAAREVLDLSCQIGDDAYFVRPNALGVADGVGGWSTRPGGNSALFSRRLMHHCSEELSRLYPPSASLQPPPPPAYDRTLEVCHSDGTLGSSTALIALLLSPSSPTSSSSVSHSQQPRLRIAHVGDCLIGLIRDNELVFRSSEQQHRFNYPYQLGPQSQTTPQKDAFRIDLPVQEGDIIVLATDGLGDNLWDEDLL
ncbi:hypothetical protein DL93DRAFT_2040592, partial [Clavulina sp. PMI_390]